MSKFKWYANILLLTLSSAAQAQVTSYQVPPAPNYQAPTVPQFQAPPPPPIALPPATGTPPTPQATQKPTSQEELALQPMIEASQQSGLAWLQLLDKGDYGASWDNAAFTMKMLMNRKEWITTAGGLRKNLGSVKSRQLIDVRTALNPVGIPSGTYMILVYQTAFSSGRSAKEILTLQQGNDGVWRTLTYLLSEAK